MSQENVEMVRRVVDAWNAHDLDRFVSLFTPDCEVAFRSDVPEPGPFRGVEEFRGWIAGFLAAWERHQVEIVEIVERGDHDALVALHHTGLGRESGLQMEWTDYSLLDFQDGKVRSWRGFGTRQEALETAGLSE